jgi:hypothetical protein
MSDKLRQFTSVKPKHKIEGTEGLIKTKDGKTIRDDSWLHPSAGVKRKNPEVRGG